MPLSAIGAFSTTAGEGAEAYLQVHGVVINGGLKGSVKVPYKVWGVGFRVHISGVISPLIWVMLSIVTLLM